MKIPQRNDQVNLTAPQSQSGRVAQPVEGSLGDSYITAMRTMDKDFQEQADLQYKLAENAIQGQLDAFNIYVESRTQQYNQDIQFATDREQLSKLFEDYKKDIADNGNVVLGNNLYQNWERAKGGTYIAGAEYTGSVANTKLMKKHNMELFKDSANALNIQAGNSVGEQREQIISQFNDMAKQAVENGTMTQAEADSQTRQFNYDLDKTDIVRLINDNPELAIKKLGTNDFAPNVTYPERQKFLSLANNTILKNSGTSLSKKVEGATSIWVNMFQAPAGSGKKGTIVLQDGKEIELEKDFEIPYYNENGKEVGILHGSYNDIAYQIAKISHDSITATRYIMQALYKKAGLDVQLSDISREDAEKFQKNMDGYVFDNLSEQYIAFNNNDNAINQKWNELGFYYKNDKDAKKGLYSKTQGELFLYRFQQGQLENINNITTVLQAANEVNGTINGSQTALYVNRNKETQKSYLEKRNAYADVLVSTIQSDDVLQPVTPVEIEMVTVLKPILDRIDTQYKGFDTKTKKRNYLLGLMDNQDFFKCFDSKSDEYWANPKNKSFERALLVAQANSQVMPLSREENGVSYIDGLYYSEKPITSEKEKSFLYQSVVRGRF